MTQSAVLPEPTSDYSPSSAAGSTPLLVPIGKAVEQPVALVGNKAHQLGRLIQTGANVPDGFCILSHALPRQPTDPLPSALTEQVVAAWQQLGSIAVAVRSSATEEDSDHASWAGLFQTRLNITSAEALLAAVRECWLSLYSDAACQFRRRLRATSTATAQAPAMAVIVQRQLNATSAGVVFTRDPMNPHNIHLCVNALQGLGEPLVSGQQSGDRYRLNRQGEVVDQQLSQQREQMTAAGMKWLPPIQGDLSTLNAVQLCELATIGHQIETLFGMPQDIEFAFEGQQLWLLQSRPIIFSPIPSQVEIKRFKQQQIDRLKHQLSMLQANHTLLHGSGLLTNSNIGELLPLPTPMSFDLFQKIFTDEGGAIPRGRQRLGYRVCEKATKYLFTLVAGQPYFHLELDARTYDLSEHQPVDSYLAQAREDTSLANYPEFGLYLQHPAACDQNHRSADNRSSAFNLACEQHYQQMVGIADHYYADYRNQIGPEIERCFGARQNNPNGRSATILQKDINKLIRHLKTGSCYHFVIAARLGFFFADAVRHQLKSYLPEQASALMGTLLQALPGSLITDHMLDLQALKSGEIPDVEFIRRYGHLAAVELEISLPRYRESPQQIRSLAVGGEPSGTCRHDFRKQIRQRKALERQVRQLLQENDIEPFKVSQLFRDLRFAQRYLPLRETIKYHFAKGYDLLRSELLIFADKVEIDSKDIFYLCMSDLSLCLSDKKAAIELIRCRKHAHQLSKSVALCSPLPAVIDSACIDKMFNESRADSNKKLQGEGIAPGFRRGRFRIIEETNDLSRLLYELRPDDILVTRSLNLGLAPLLHSVAGLAVEVGGFLAHGACQAREAGIPAVVLSGATRLLRNGQEATLDGNLGIIEII